jgi:hypothetical protein
MDGFKCFAVAALIPFLVSAVTHSYAASDTFIDLDAGIGLDDNVTRAALNEDIEHDGFVSLGASLGHELFRGRVGQITGNLDLTINQFAEFDGLSHYTAGGGIKYLFGFSGGFGAPWFGLGLKYFVSEFDSFLRDSNTFIGSFTVGKRIDDLTNLRTAFTYKSRDSDGLAFDTEDVSFFVNIDWTLGEKTTLYTTYKIQEGDVVSTAASSSVSLYVINAASGHIESDDVFSGKLNYRLDSTTQLFTVGLNIARDLESAYDVSARFLTTDADGGLEYEDLTIRFSYFHRIGLEF